MALNLAQLMATPGGPGIVGAIKAGVGLTLSPDGTLSVDPDSVGFPAGTKQAFYQATAPVGWVQVTDTAVADSAIRIVNGTGGGTAGGTVSFSTIFNPSTTVSGALTFTSGETASTALDINQIPSHSHGVSDPGHSHGVGDPGHAHNPILGSTVRNDGGTQSRTAGSRSDLPLNCIPASGTGIGIAGSGTGISIQNNGGNGGHTHGLSGTTANFSYSSASMNIKYLNFIVCTKS